MACLLGDMFTILFTVADPGFPVGGGTDPLGGGVPTSDAYTFR